MNLAHASKALLDPADAIALTTHGENAAVLVPLRLHADDTVHCVFTKRRDDLSKHAGEISFPGGRPEDHDKDLVATALREAHEEIGLLPGDVNLLGALPPISTYVTNFAIYPFVGVVAAELIWTPQQREVESVLEFELGLLASVYERREIVRLGFGFETDAYEIDGHLIWGATARILTTTLDRLQSLIV